MSKPTPQAKEFQLNYRDEDSQFIKPKHGHSVSQKDRRTTDARRRIEDLMEQKEFDKEWER